ncbi:hypothetical protein MMG85_16890 [Pseudoxanthomonas sp. LH2527]|uniref:hypothetical protein n=1 Tax=Pseudoxanthomonas sp. LH2527 TaxID=2923249 RepID=UPI001F12CB7E|nr:hypothetical protein [Pseudoxanthomonas sp. LH2527]MCH6485231.1 hypothetical protein [Pseudoxanthomonas sp. LH2527]
MHASPCPCCDHARSLRAHLVADDIDAAIAAGLMAFQPCTCAGDDTVLVMQARQRLRIAWDARERYRQRQVRLARRAAEREARRLKVAEATGATAAARPALPTGAAAILARAKAKAAERMKR